MDNRKYGYVRINSRSLRRKGLYRHHQLIAMEALGRPLRKGEEVHHVDGDGSNNSHSNLVICNRAFHMHMHFLGRVAMLGHSRASLMTLHHQQGLPLEAIRRRLNLGGGMIGRWFKRLNIEIRRGIGGKGSLAYNGLL